MQESSYVAKELVVFEKKLFFVEYQSVNQSVSPSTIRGNLFLPI